MRYRPMVAVAFAASTLLAAGCGSTTNKTNSSTDSNHGSGSGKSSVSLSRTDLVAQTNEVCKHMHSQVLALEATRTKTPAQTFSQAGTYERAALGELLKLKPPAAISSDWRQVVTTVRTLSEDSIKYGEYTKAKNPHGALAFINSYNASKPRIVEMAKHDGFDQCAIAF